LIPVLILFLQLSNGSAHSDEELSRAERLTEKSVQLCKEGKYGEAIPFAEEALAIRERISGPEHPDVADSLTRLAEIHESLRQYPEALLLYERSLSIWEKTLGPEHLQVADSLNSMALLDRSMGDYSKALPLYERSLSIRKEILGPEHPDVATSLNNLAVVYHSMGEYAKALPLYERSLDIRKKVLGSEHPDVATSLNNLASLYHSVGEYLQALSLHERSLSIWEKTLGPEHPNVASSLNYLAELYRSMGEYAKALPLYERALHISEKTLGSEHPNVASSLNNLAELYRSMGEYAKALPLYERALHISEKTLGSEHPNVANSLNSMAQLHNSLGEYAKALLLFDRALSIWEKTLGPGHPNVAVSLNNLAGLHRSMGEYAKALLLYECALSIRENALGPEHPDVAASLNNLAELYRSMGEYVKALPLYERSLGIWEKAFGPEHPDVASSLNNLADLHSSVGEYPKARSLYERSLGIWEKMLGPDHPNVAVSLGNLAVLCATMGDFAKARTYHRRSQEITEIAIENIFAVTSEKQKLSYLNRLQSEGDIYFNSLLHLANDSKATREGVDFWLRRKGRVLDAQSQHRKVLFRTGGPQISSAFQELSSIQNQISRLTFSGPGQMRPEIYQGQIRELKAKQEDLEVSLTRLSKTFSLEKKMIKVDSSQVAGALPPGSVLIDFARPGMYDFAGKGNSEKRWKPGHYVAFVLRAGEPDDPRLVDLGGADEIDRAVAEFRKELTDIKGVVNEPEKAEEQLSERGRRLYSLVLAPLRKYLGEGRQVFLSPEGNLNLLPFEALKGPEGRYLIEDYRFSYLTTGRDVLRFNQEREKSEGVVVMADPDFDLSLEAREGKANGMVAASPGPEGETQARTRSMGSLYFSPLPGTREEAEWVARELEKSGEKVKLYEGEGALEDVLKKEKAPRILHLATHGFFFPEEDVPVSETRGSMFAEEEGRNRGRSLGAERVENPMLRSGLAMAGANVAVRQGMARPQIEDGLLSAYEVSGLNLTGTELVVLSACETGIGDLRVGEGVFGLRRAFIQAGAKSLVVSLWKVEDRATSELMREFYRGMREMDKGEAMRQAKLKLKETRSHPFFWAPFVLMGDWK
jgi:CHAT domain-containing protein/tetratricopeptide (TPR) repeat protein